VQILVEDILKNKGWSFIINDLLGERYALHFPMAAISSGHKHKSGNRKKGYPD
jgi:hypothetical protein